jgi:hypothetical protein
VVIGFDPGHETSYLSAEWHDFNFIPGGEMWIPWVKLSSRGEVGPRGEDPQIAPTYVLLKRRMCKQMGEHSS